MIPSPVYWFTIPSKRWIPSLTISKKRFRMACQRSGSTCPASSSEPFTSAKSTVTCLRSPSRADTDCRIRLVRCGANFRAACSSCGTDLRQCGACFESKRAEGLGSGFVEPREALNERALYLVAGSHALVCEQ